MARLKPDLLERTESFAERVVSVAEAVSRKRIAWRIVDQVVASGTAVAANLFEADEAMSRKDFCKCVAIANKELNETRFWLRLIQRKAWVIPTRIDPLLLEAAELRLVLGSILARTRKRDTSAKS